MDKLQMAKALLVTEENAYTKGGQTVTAYGIAVSDSVDGLVRINLGGDTVSPEDDQAIEVETTFSVKEGDEVIVSLIGADGTGKTPIVIGVIGRGDEQQGEIDTALDLAAEANGAASVGKITPQHFFYNSQGAFVTSDEVTCDTFNGDGVVTNFTLSGTPYNSSLLALYVAGASVISGYSVSGDVLTFDSAPTGSIVALWVASEMQDYAKMDSDSFDIVKATDTVASFGREVTVGSRDSFGTIGMYSQVFGQKCVASAPYSRASGFNTIAGSAYQSVSGRNNAEDDTGTYAEIVGNGEYPIETEEFTTDGETINFTLQHEPLSITDITLQSSSNLCNAVFSKPSGSFYGIVTIPNAYEYDLPICVHLYTAYGKYEDIYLTIPKGETEITFEFHSYSDGHPTTVSSPYSKPFLSDQYSISSNTLTLLDSAAYWASLFSGITLSITYEYEGTTLRSNARTLDWDGNEKISGKLVVRNKLNVDAEVVGIKKVKLCDINFATTTTLNIRIKIDQTNRTETIIPYISSTTFTTFVNNFSAGRIVPTVGRPMIYEIIGTRDSSSDNKNRYASYERRIVEANVTTAAYYSRSTQIEHINISSAAFGTSTFAVSTTGTNYSSSVQNATDDNLTDFWINIPKTGGGRLQVIAYSIGLDDDYDEV